LSSYALQIVGRGCGGEHFVHAWDVRLAAKIHGIVELGDAGADSFVAACNRVEGVAHRHIVGHGQHKGELLVRELFDFHAATSVCACQPHHFTAREIPSRLRHRIADKHLPATDSIDTPAHRVAGKVGFAASITKDGAACGAIEFHDVLAEFLRQPAHLGDKLPVLERDFPKPAAPMRDDALRKVGDVHHEDFNFGEVVFPRHDVGFGDCRRVKDSRHIEVIDTELVFGFHARGEKPVAAL
jgi:hypothetical protein